jgi:ATPase subunit of ABC transporter with duplicated ATPase domains
MLQITNLTYNAWGRAFLDNASVSLPPGAKVGLVGRNGIGKSTLFKLILGELAGRRRRDQPAARPPASARSTRSTRPRRSACWRRFWKPTSSATP